MDRSQLSCLNPDCSEYGKVGAGNIGIHSYADKRYYCTVCKSRFSARQGTIFYKLKTDEEKVLTALKMLSEHSGIRGTARILGTSKDTIGKWLAKAAQHTEAVSDLLIRELDISQAQIDELWSFVKKKGRSQKPAGSGSR